MSAVNLRTPRAISAMPPITIHPHLGERVHRRERLGDGLPRVRPLLGEHLVGALGGERLPAQPALDRGLLVPAHAGTATFR